MKALTLSLLFAAVAHGKVVHIRIPVPGSQEGSYWRDQYTVDENMLVWRLRNAVFHDFRLDPKEYVLAEETSSGYAMLEVDARVGDYGSDAGAPVQLFAVPRRMVRRAE